jgi:hypothetical protein
VQPPDYRTCLAVGINCRLIHGNEHGRAGQSYIAHPIKAASGLAWSPFICQLRPGLLSYCADVSNPHGRSVTNCKASVSLHEAR